MRRNKTGLSECFSPYACFYCYCRKAPKIVFSNEPVLFPMGRALDPSVSRVVVDRDWDMPYSSMGLGPWDLTACVVNGPARVAPCPGLDLAYAVDCDMGMESIEASEPEIHVSAGRDLMVVSFRGAVPNLQKDLMQKALTRLVESQSPRPWFSLVIDAGATIESFRAVIDDISGDSASVTLLDIEGESIAALDLSRNEIVKHGVSFRVGATFDLEIQKIGDCERLVLHPVEPDPLGSPELEILPTAWGSRQVPPMIDYPDDPMQRAVQLRTPSHVWKVTLENAMDLVGCCDVTPRSNLPLAAVS